jgi:hypothetical protein
MKYEKILERGKKTYYKFSDLIRKDSWGKDLEKPTQYVAVSDVHSHIERLVFPIYFAEGFGEQDLLNQVKHCLDRPKGQIDGVWTMMIHGGDPDAVYEHEYYLDRLVAANT